ncbi:MAG: serine/threonine-protein kinase [Acidobacteria bacterium]|nr:serine/threonine-protein kinase [Acidobacteriota bacterium]
MSLSAGTRLGPYEILAPLGAGGMGEVYRARDTRLGRDVALKVLPDLFSGDAERMARFSREAQLLASLNHPNIAILHGLEESGGVRALVMELVEGPTLAERIREGPIAIDEALPIGKQIAEALEAAHEKGIIHRDLKPANIKIKRDGAVKVLDFGLAKALECEASQADASHSPTISLGPTRAGVILGTAAYMSPEQAKGKSVDRRADIWAFGVVLYEMLAGKQIYSGETAPETLASVMKDEPNWNALPANTPAAIRKLLRRLRDIGEARITIEEAISGEGAEEAAVLPAAPTDRPGGLSYLVAIAVLLATTLALAFIHFREAPIEQAAMRFTVSPPEKATFADPFAISPDGRRLALVVNAPGGNQSIWIRRLDSLDAQPLPGTEGANHPFWSPDSRFIGFFAQGKLKKIEASSGPALTLCDASAGLRGTWSRDGVIVFPDATGVLHRVSAEGGASTPITTLDQSRQEDGHVWPHFLPDGRHFLYYAASAANRQNEHIYAGSLDSKDRRRLVASNWMPAYAPAGDGRGGYLLFVREGTLMAQRFNPDRLELSGEPFPVVERVTDPDPNSTAFYSVSANGVLAHWTSGATNAQLVWFDRGGKRLGTVGAPGDAIPSLSPDQKRVAVQRGPSANTDIWLLDLARSTASRFTFDPAVDEAPIWSPDGSRIVFDSNRDSNVANLYQKASSGVGNEELLLKSGESKYPCDWSSDGRFIVYTSFNAKTGYDLWVLPMEGDRKPFPFLQTQFFEGDGRFSPDGQWMAYLSNESGRMEVYVQPFNPRPGGPAEGAPSGPGGKWQVSTAGGWWPSWRRDGKELFYIAPPFSADGKLMAVDVKAVATKSRAAFEAGVPKALFDTRIPNIPIPPYAAAPDGRRFLVNTTAGEEKARSLTVAINWQAGLKR